MKKLRRSNLVVASLAMLVGLAAGPLVNAENIEPDADEILRSMSAYLAGATAFSVNADIDLEIITRDGQKLQLSSAAALTMKRPDKLRLERKGPVADVDIFFNGQTLTLHGKNLDVYARTEVSGTIDDAILAYELETGLPAPGADLLFADPYAVLSSGVESGVHIGTGYVDGVECHHLAFREADVDWQLWVRAGDAPVPMKYVITSKWQTGAPQYQVRLRDWNVDPQLGDEQFVFSVPKDARQLETLPVGGFSPAEEGQ